MKKLRVAVCLLVLGLLVPAILQLRGKMPIDTQPLIEKKYGGWAGVLRLWVYEGWKPGGGNMAGWLNKCVGSFEKKHPGVYVQPEYVDGATMRALGRDGLAPDMAIFPPGGLESAAALTSIEDFNYLCFFSTQCHFVTRTKPQSGGKILKSEEEINAWLENRGLGGRISMECDTDMKDVTEIYLLAGE